MIVLIRGAGDLASGIALRLFHSGFQVIMTDIDKPTSIRRTVSFSEAIRLGNTIVEDVKAEFATSVQQALRIMNQKKIALLVDPEASSVHEIKPLVLVDAILAKKNLGTRITDATIVIGVGPGFESGVDCHAVVETMRGHTLGRVIYNGSAIPNTNIPGLIEGFAEERVLRAPADGIFEGNKKIKDIVQKGDVIGIVNGKEMVATIDGVVRGLIADGTEVVEGMKTGDIDPRGNVTYCDSVSDKALAIGGGVLEAILHLGGMLNG